MIVYYYKEASAWGGSWWPIYAKYHREPTLLMYNPNESHWMVPGTVDPNE